MTLFPGRAQGEAPCSLPASSPRALLEGVGLQAAALPSTWPGLQDPQPEPALPDESDPPDPISAGQRGQASGSDNGLSAAMSEDIAGDWVVSF